MNNEDKKNKNITKTIVALIAALAVFVGIYFLYDALSKSNLDKVQSGQTLQEDKAVVTSSSGSDSTDASLEATNTDTATAEESTASTSSETDYTAPELKILDVEGNEVKLADFKGKTVVLNFWASWCPPCKAEFPDFQKFYDDTKGDDKVAMVLVNLIGSNGETKEHADAFINDNNYTLPYFYDIEGQTANTYGIQSIPTTYIINPAGELYYRNIGIMSYDSLVEITAKAGE